MENGIYYLLAFTSVVVASFSQILLKKSSMKKYPSLIREYVNPYVICGYGMLFASMLLTIQAYGGLAFMNVPIIESLGYVIVMILSYLFFREKITLRKLAGMAFVLGGIAIYYT